MDDLYSDWVVPTVSLEQRDLRSDTGIHCDFFPVGESLFATRRRSLDDACIELVSARQRHLLKVLSHCDGAAKPSSQSISPIEHHDLVSRVRERVQRLIAALHVPEGVPEVIPASAGQYRAFTS